MINGNGHATLATDRQASADLAGFYAAAIASINAGDAIDQAFARQMSEIHAGYFALSKNYPPAAPRSGRPSFAWSLQFRRTAWHILRARSSASRSSRSDSHSSAEPTQSARVV